MLSSEIINAPFSSFRNFIMGPYETYSNTYFIPIEKYVLYGKIDEYVHILYRPLGAEFNKQFNKMLEKQFYFYTSFKAVIFLVYPYDIALIEIKFCEEQKQ